MNALCRVMEFKSKCLILLPKVCFKCLNVLNFELYYNSTCRLSADIFFTVDINI